MNLRPLLLLAVLLLGPLAPGDGLAATTPDEQLSDPVLEQRARLLGRELRCLVCQNQSIDDSEADLARDLRRIVRERIVAGDGDDQILDYLRARYGEFVLLRPPVVPATWPLWFGPPLLLLAGGAAAFLWRRRSTSEPVEAWTATEQAALDRALSDAGGSPPERQPGRPAQ